MKPAREPNRPRPIVLLAACVPGKAASRPNCAGDPDLLAVRPRHLLFIPGDLMNASFDHLREDLWVFAYGSLIWRPGFDFVERVQARVVGAHRALCILSHVHRGTPERPGLVLGLDRGGMCRGVAYRVDQAVRPATLSYLRAREQVTAVYVECVRRVTLLGSPERIVRAVCYMADRSHPQYAGRLDLATQLHHIRQGHGQSGANRDYLMDTVKALESLGYRDRELHILAERLHGTLDARADA